MVSEFLPFLAMVLVQLGYAVMNIVSKLAMDTGMKPLVLVVYRQIFATLAILPFAYFLERPRITMPILFQTFLCSLTGATINQVFYFIGLKLSTPTIGCALTNTLPAITFILAVIFRQESMGIKKMAGQAKVMGTTVCVAGAMLLSFYHGPILNIGESSIHWKYAENASATNSSGGSNSVVGALFVIASALGWAVWFIIQARLSVTFPAPYTTTALMCFMATIECGIIGVSVEHKLSAWSLRSPIRIVASVYAGVVCNALAFCLMSYSIQRKGALYVSVFSPLMLVLVAILSWALLREKLSVGTLTGSLLIVSGLYAVLWGKEKETKLDNMSENGVAAKEDEDHRKDDLEFQMPAISNANNHHSSG
ncbi:EamA domain-containing protein [Cephalotus follicularis]|uniref:WAT1-related protein n=1 Tax=Cephalotus follicularis TaxID=3775 RepID=A0A1Q3BG00_CEPFO|nr:EamA domain-containing protein [Cephalotus follicularis]